MLFPLQYSVLQQGLASFFCKGTDSRYFRHLGPGGVSVAQPFATSLFFSFLFLKTILRWWCGGMWGCSGVFGLRARFGQARFVLQAVVRQLLSCRGGNVSISPFKVQQFGNHILLPWLQDQAKLYETFGNAQNNPKMRNLESLLKSLRVSDSQSMK